MSERQITACIDGSTYSLAACDAAVWAAARTGAPLTLVHAIGRPIHAPAADTSGQIGFGAREHLLTELAELDARRAQLEQEKGRHMLEAATERAVSQGVSQPASRQRNGELVEALVAMEDQIRLLVLGKRGERADTASEHLGPNLERVIRSLSCPILITPETFIPPKRVLIAFDASTTACRMIERAVDSPLVQGIACHLVYVGTPDTRRQRDIDWAAQTLTASGADVTVDVIEGEVEAALRSYEQAHDIDLLVMGAYGHSRIRHLLVGSTTTDMIRRAEMPVLITR